MPDGAALQPLLTIALAALAAVLGWRLWVLRRAQRGPEFGSHYFRGLNYLLNEQPDKALEVFLELAEVNHDTIETHLALGSLFRRRGEVEHAIRCHENVMQRETLTPDERLHALGELAEDYRRSGLLDRAEDLYRELATHEAMTRDALERLLEIYEQERDWPRAIETAERLLHDCAAGDQLPLTHYYCELAELRLAERDTAGAGRQIERALHYDPDCLRAHLLRIQLHLAEGEPAAALDLLRQAASRNPAEIGILLDPLGVACAAGAADPVDELRRWVPQALDPTVAIRLAHLLVERRQRSAAAQLLLEQLHKQPSLDLFSAYFNLADQGHFSAHGDELRPLIAAAALALLNAQPRFRCTQCGYGGKTHHWQCPSCKHWDTTHPAVADGEL